MGSLEQKGLSPREVYISPEVFEMRRKLIEEAKNIFQENHELVKEAMGMGKIKAGQVLHKLAECRGGVRKEIEGFENRKKKIYS